MGSLKRYAFMFKIFPFLEQVATWKSFYSALLRFSAAGTALLAITFCLHNFRKWPNLNWQGDIGICIFNLGVIVTAYMVIHLFWNRSQGIRYLEEESYPILRICSHIVRLTGELFAALCFGLGISTGLTILVAGKTAFYITYGLGFYELGVRSMWLNGITTMIAGMGYGVLSLLLGRMCYEGMILMIDVANNIRRMRITLQTKRVFSNSSEENKQEIA